MKNGFIIFLTICITIMIHLIIEIEFKQFTDRSLTKKANEIRNETEAGANTKERVANMFQGLIDNKVSWQSLLFVLCLNNVIWLCAVMYYLTDKTVLTTSQNSVDRYVNKL